MIPLRDVIFNPNTVLTVGTFDGVHEGHKVLLRTVVEEANKLSCRSLAVTFDPHPREIIQPGKAGVKLLTTLDERAAMLAELGINEMVVIPFDRDFSLLSSDEFIERILFQKIGIKKMVIGYDHHFGRDRAGSIDTVKKVAQRLHFDVQLVSAKEIEQTTISSSAVRRALEVEGDVHVAETFLGRPYQLTGTVVTGDGNGKKIGFPTANIMVTNPKKIIPHNGVYAVRVTVNNTTYSGMMNIGYRPTFGKSLERVLEVHILDFNDDIYGNKIAVSFIDRIREEKKFRSVEELVSQLYVDKMNCISRL